MVVTRIWEPACDSLDLIDVLEVPEVVVLADVPDFTEPREITELDEVPEGRVIFPPSDPGTIASFRLRLLAEVVGLWLHRASEAPLLVVGPGARSIARSDQPTGR